MSDIEQMRMSLGQSGLNEQEQFWAGADGDAYTARNRYDWRLRIPFWTQILDRTAARSVYEFGCNVGFNLSAIRRAFPDVKVAGEDLNATAATRAATCDGLYVTQTAPHTRQPWPHELAFTVGVLIHIAPGNLKAFMQRVIDASCDWVLAVEYASDNQEAEAQEIEYRGRANLLWRRNYGLLYADMGLEIVDHFALERPAFDNCHAWLMRKP